MYAHKDLRSAVTLVSRYQLPGTNLGGWDGSRNSNNWRTEVAWYAWRCLYTTVARCMTDAKPCGKMRTFSF